MPRGRGSNMRWDQISAQGVGSPAESMRNAMTGISQVGTVFGDLRKSILDEEQRTVENAFKEREAVLKERTQGFTEEKFGKEHQLNIDKQAFEEGPKFQLEKDKFGEIERHNKEQERIGRMNASAQSIIAQEAKNRGTRDQATHDLNMQVANEIAAETTRLSAPKAQLDTKYEELKAGLARIDPKTTDEKELAYKKGLENELLRIGEERKQYSAGAMDQQIRNVVAQKTGIVPAKTPFTDMAIVEQTLSAQLKTASDKRQKEMFDHMDKFQKWTDTFDTDSQNLANSARARLIQLFPNLNVEVIDNMIMSAPSREQVKIRDMFKYGTRTLSGVSDKDFNLLLNDSTMQDSNLYKAVVALAKNKTNYSGNPAAILQQQREAEKRDKELTTRRQRQKDIEDRASTIRERVSEAESTKYD